jgi:hypothetical protein
MQLRYVSSTVHQEVIQVTLFDPARVNPEAGSRLWTEAVVRRKLATDGWHVACEVERAAAHARGWLEDERTHAPELAGARARMLTALDGAAKVVADADGQERSRP